MKSVEIILYIWAGPESYSNDEFTRDSKRGIEIAADDNKKKIIFNHYIKRYAKNFECPKSTLTWLISKSKNMIEGTQITVKLPRNIGHGWSPFLKK